MSPDLWLLGRVVADRARVARRDRWTRDQLLAFQRHRLERLLHHAATRSPYYREVLAGRGGTDLGDLPVLTKASLMAHWDEICTDRGLSLSALEARLGQIEQTHADPGRGWQGRWWLAATGGTTGRRAALAWDRREWTQVLASYARVNDWAGVLVDLRHPLRTAIVSSLNPTHQSAVVGASLRSRLVPALRLDAREPLDVLTRELDAFQPRLLVAYSSMIGPLAAAQLEGHLHISPEKVVAASEVLPGPSRAAALSAWGADVVVDVYATTETAGIASTCPQGGWHLYEDFVVVEPVDADYRRVPAGMTADRLLVTPLFARTLPLIRYELTDSVRLSASSCACGRPFALLDKVEGRTEDTLVLAGTQGPVRVHPIVFHTALESLAPQGWQVEQRPDRLVVRVVCSSDALDLARERIVQALQHLGVADPAVELVSVGEIERTALGKAPLVKALPASP